MLAKHKQIALHSELILRTRSRWISLGIAGTRTRFFFTIKRCSTTQKTRFTRCAAAAATARKRKLTSAFKVEEFWRFIAICHTVIPERNDDDQLEYQAQSPDEAALTAAARNFGFVFKSRTPTSITLEIGEKEEASETDDDKKEEFLHPIFCV